MLYRRKIVFTFLWMFIMSGLGSRQVCLYFFGKIVDNFSLLFLPFFSFCILIHSYQKSKVLVERERDARKIRLSTLVLTVFLVHDKPKIKCFAFFFFG